LGLLRGVFETTGTGPKSNRVPYVFTNPTKDTELFACDKVFVLSIFPESILRKDHKPNTLGNSNSSMRRKTKTTEDVLNVVQSLREEIGNLSVYTVQLDQELSSLSCDFQKRIAVAQDNVNKHLPQSLSSKCIL
jgi:hypothetical protein